MRKHTQRQTSQTKIFPREMDNHTYLHISLTTLHTDLIVILVNFTKFGKLS